MSQIRYPSPATRSAVPGPARAAAARLADIVSAVRGRRARRAAIHELSRLDDRLLRDIGIHRVDIPAVVDGMLRRPPVAARRSAPELQVVAVDVTRPAAARDDDLANAA